jgi:Ca-activated chloride channel homolog
MVWRAPQLLWLLALVPLAAVFFVWALRRRRAALRRFAEARLLPALTPDLDERRHRWRAAMLVGAVGLLAVTLAGPKWGFHWEKVERRGVDLVVALDTSRSMLAEDVKPSRIERAKLAVEDLLKQLHGDRVGLVAFAGSAFVQCPLTLDYEAFAESLRAVTVGIIPRGGTSLAAAITSGIRAFEGHQGKHEALILITDGEDHDGRVEEAAKQAAALGIKIYTVGIGTTGGDLIPITVNGQQTFLKNRQGEVVKSHMDAALLEKIAALTGGAYVHAEGAGFGLGKVYTDYIDNMEKRDLSTTIQRHFEQRFQWPLLAVLALLVLEPLVGERHRRSAPPPPAAGTRAG